MLDGFPFGKRTQATGRGTRETDVRCLADAHGIEHLPVRLGRHAQRHLGGADVGAFLDDLLQRHQFLVAVRVTNDIRADLHEALARVEHRRRRVAATVERQRGGEHLQGRTRLVQVGNGAVAQAIAVERAAVGRVVRRPVGQRQHLTVAGIEHHSCARLGLLADHRFLDGLERLVLDAGIDGELQVAAVLRLADLVDVADDATAAIPDDPAAARLAGQRGLEGQFEPFLTHVGQIGETDEVGGDLAFGIVALVFAVLADAVDAQGGNPLGGVQIDLTLQEGEVAVTMREPGLQLVGLHAQQTGEVDETRIIQVHTVGIGPDGACRQAGRQHHAMTVENPAPVGLQLDGLFIALGTLRLEEGLGSRLQIERLGKERRERHEQQRKHETRAPQLQTRLQQVRGGEFD